MFLLYMDQRYTCIGKPRSNSLLIICIGYFLRLFRRNALKHGTDEMAFYGPILAQFKIFKTFAGEVMKEGPLKQALGTHYAEIPKILLHCFFSSDSIIKWALLVKKTHQFCFKPEPNMRSVAKRPCRKTQGPLAPGSFFSIISGK